MEQVKSDDQRTRGIRMKKYITIIAIVIAVVGVAGLATYGVLVAITPKNNNTTKQQSSPAEIKARANVADADAKKLMDEAAKLGNGKKADEKTQQAIDKFNEASKLYEQAGDKNASLEAKANADMLANRLAAEAGYKAEIEAQRKAERDQQQAEQKAAESSDKQ